MPWLKQTLLLSATDMREKSNLFRQKYSEVADISSATSFLHLEELAHRKFTAPKTGNLTGIDQKIRFFTGLNLPCVLRASAVKSINS